MGFLLKQHHQDVSIELFRYSQPILLMPNRLVEVEAVYPHSALLAENFRVAQPPAFWQKAVQLESTNLCHFARLLFQFPLLVQSRNFLYIPNILKVFHNAGNAL